MKNHITKLFQGRADRKTFLLAIVWLLIILLTASLEPTIYHLLSSLPFHFLSLLPIDFGFLLDSELIFITTTLSLSILVLIPLAVLPMPITVKRLHDIGWSGWFFIPMVIPIINLLFTLFLLIKPGKKETNQYGEVPVYSNNKALIFIWTITILLFIVIVGLNLLAPSSLSQPR